MDGRELFIDTTGKHNTRSGAVAESAGGYRYAAGGVASQTHLLDIPAELAALMRAAHARDYAITSVESVMDAPMVSPLALKILSDHAARSGTPIRYRLRATDGTEFFSTDDVSTALPFYKMSAVPLALAQAEARSEPITESTTDDVEAILWERAKDGTTRNFPTRDGASGYGAAVRSKDGRVYAAGQYSSFEHRLGIHAEAGALIGALMSGMRDFTHLAVVSTKFKDVPCSPCGACRQLIAEISARYELQLEILCFAYDHPRVIRTSIDALLPSQWKNTV